MLLFGVAALAHALAVVGIVVPAAVIGIGGAATPTRGIGECNESVRVGCNYTKVH